MKKSVILLLLLLSFAAGAQERPQNIPLLAADSLTGENGITDFFFKNWIFCEGDDPAMAMPGYDDSKWEKVNSTLNIDPNSKSKFKTFNSIGWFRLHFIADSGITGVPLVMRIAHYGASEIFLDGKKIDSFGLIRDRDNSIYYDPHYLPFSIRIANTGEHVLAIRYANYNAQRNLSIYKDNSPGFKMDIGEADYLMKYERSLDNFNFINGILFGIFIALSVLHLFLFLYYRTSRSNLFFSIFCISISILFLNANFSETSHSPAYELNSVFIVLVATAAACFSFSGFTHELFSDTNIRLRIVSAVCIIAPLTWVWNNVFGTILFFTLIVYVFVEAIVFTVDAISKKVKGARIIGTGILSFTLFFLFILVLTFVLKGLTIDETTPLGRIVLGLSALAILSLPFSMSLYLAWSFSSVNNNLVKQLQQVEDLSEKNLQQEQEKKRILEGQKEKLEEEVTIRTNEVVLQKEKIEKQHNELKVEKKKSDDLLLNILPEEIAEELKETGRSEARFFNNVTVLFTDFVDFTQAGETMTPQELVDELHICFKTFDEIISRHHIEKIKTIGDAYLAVCGLPLPDAQHAINVANAALEIIQFMAQRKLQHKEKVFDIRIGIHSGSVVAGIVGVKKFAYDIWGDTVNTAARMEQNSEPGKINSSQTTYELVKDKFECTYRGNIKAKNKGEMSMYFIEKKKEDTPPQ